MTSVEQRVIRIVARAAMVTEGTITPDTRLEDLDMDSLEQIECALAVEETFQVELGDPQVWRFRTVRDVIDAVQRARDTPPGR
jgi:acyl carrier protein